ncbi:histidine kinase [Kordia sp. YSTF-M3]|uniref:Histidine kinase n=1 Tax=Kordia aestuariivivens TaxID=2759037 RepID=A0ABR7Q9F2_9FLAO|nr:histidine kinase [Kordia aestuariivivens]MBC8755202.1 histidine kinase [Kordia aestuariivivens]
MRLKIYSSKTLLFFCISLLFTTITCSQNSYYFNFNTNNGLPSAQCYHTYEDSKGYLWFTTDRGISKYDGNTFYSYLVEDGLANLVNFKFYPDPLKKDAFWVNGFDGSFSYWNGEKFSPFTFNLDLLKLKSKGSWFQIFNIKKNTIYFFEVFAKNKTQCPEIYYKINTTTGKIDSYTFTKDTEVGKNLSSEVLYTLKNCGNETRTSNFLIHSLFDQKGNYWELTREGAFFYEKGDTLISPTTYFKNIPISSLYEDSKGSYWFTSLNNGVFYVPSLVVKKINLHEFSDSFCNLIKNYNDALILSFNEQGKSIIISPEGKIFKIDLYKEDNDTQISKKLNLITTDLEDVLPYSYNQFRITKKHLLVKRGSSFLVNEYLSGKQISSKQYDIKTTNFLKDTHGKLWIGAIDGLYSLTITDSLQLVKEPFLDTEIPIRVNDITQSSEGFWIATLSRGLYFKKETSYNLYQIPSLRNQSIQSLCQENDTTLWIGTNKGLHKVKYNYTNEKPKIKSSEIFTIDDGLPSNFINDMILWNDKLYIATDKGVGYFNPSELIKNAREPKLVIDKIFINGKEVEYKLSYNKLTFNENTITINFTGIIHHKPVHPNYFFRYKVNDSDWNYTNSSSINFNTLPHGIYKISVQCQNNSGNWSVPKTVQFIIPPHFTRHWLFITTLLFIIGFTTIKLIRWRIHIIKKRAKQNIAFKEAQLAVLRNQMNPHFVFNSLNTLQDYIFEGNAIGANDYITSFSSLMRKSLEFSKLESITLQEEIAFIKNYLSLEQQRFQGKFRFEIHQSSSIEGSILIPPLLVQPLVENAIKHAFKKNRSEEGMIEVNYKPLNQDTILIEIVDNGDGFQYKKPPHTSNTHTSLGIEIIQERIRLINEKKGVTIAHLKYLVKSKGTHIQLILPKY